MLNNLILNYDYYYILLLILKNTGFCPVSYRLMYKSAKNKTRINLKSISFKRPIIRLKRKYTLWFSKAKNYRKITKKILFSNLTL